MTHVSYFVLSKTDFAVIVAVVLSATVPAMLTIPLSDTVTPSVSLVHFKALLANPAVTTSACNVIVLPCGAVKVAGVTVTLVTEGVVGTNTHA